MAVTSGRIEWIGREKDIPSRYSAALTDDADALSGTVKVVDLQNRRVIPGFVDAHMHPVCWLIFRKRLRQCLRLSVP